VLTAASVAVLVGGGLGIALASAPSGHRGGSSYGMTHAYYAGVGAGFTYSKGYYCDTTVSSSAKTKCEAGANFKKAPAKDYDPLYITVPLGFSRSMGMIDCPANLTCVDHPGTIDLTRLEPALKPLYPQLTADQLRKALRNFRTPEHDHFVTTVNGGQPEWWDVKVIGVTSAKVYQNIRKHKSFGYIQHLLRTKNKAVVGPIPTNLFLYFSVQ
jgi:hypothetical protein